LPGVFGGIGLITLVALLRCGGQIGSDAALHMATGRDGRPDTGSALIHRGTMVTAGVYMCARSAALFELAPETKLIIVVVGALTALFAGRQRWRTTTSRKCWLTRRCRSWASCSWVSARALTSRRFSMSSRTLSFKACLFLGAGSVIHALHGEQDMRKMGGLKGKMKATNLTFMLSGLALAGAAPFAGFFSKDEIIAGVWNFSGEYNSIYKIIAIVGLVTAFITALYTGRQYAQVFEGKARDEHLYDHAHESPSVMTVPLWILAIGACVTGFLGFPHLPGVPAQLHGFSEWLKPVFSVQADASHAAAGQGHHDPDGALWILLRIWCDIGWGGWFMGARWA
jgi:NADH-quinone oxidoreductase subunit L